MEVKKKTATLDQRKRADAKCRELQSMLHSWKVSPISTSRVKPLPEHNATWRGIPYEDVKEDEND